MTLIEFLNLQCLAWDWFFFKVRVHSKVIESFALTLKVSNFEISSLELFTFETNCDQYFWQKTMYFLCLKLRTWFFDSTVRFYLTLFQYVFIKGLVHAYFWHNSLYVHQQHGASYQMFVQVMESADKTEWSVFFKSWRLLLQLYCPSFHFKLTLFLLRFIYKLL